MTITILIGLLWLWWRQWIRHLAVASQLGQGCKDHHKGERHQRARQDDGRIEDSPQSEYLYDSRYTLSVKELNPSYNELNAYLALNLHVQWTVPHW